MKIFHYKNNVYFAQAANCLFCIHIGYYAFFFFTGIGKRRIRLELFTPYHKFRFSKFSLS